MLWHDSGLNLALNCGMMPSLKSEQEAPDFSSLLEFHRLNLMVLDFDDILSAIKGQLISECLFEKIVWTKIPTKNLIDSAH